MIYFDNAATTITDEDVLNAMKPYLSTEFGNPSALYPIGEVSHKAICESKKKFAKAFNCHPEQIFFTSGGSEGDTWIIRGVIDKNFGSNKNHIITSQIEHHAVLNTCKLLEGIGNKVTYVPVDSNGIVNVDDVKKAITKNTALISIMYVNNEVGSVQPIKEISRIAHEHGILVHTDAVQAVGHMPIDVDYLDVDFMTVSCHKFYAPKGIGVCYIRNPELISPLICGGKQENGIRGGTENVPYIVGAGVAIEKSTKNIIPENISTFCISNIIRNKLLKEVDGVTFNNSIEKSIGTTLNVSFDGVDGEIMQLELARKGICVSTGSACNSGNKSPSHVLTAMGIDRKRALNSIRISVGRFNSMDEAIELVQSIKEICNKIKWQKGE